LNSGNWQNATPVITGQTIELLLTNHTLINDSLPGTVTTAYPNGEDRQARVRFTTRTTCGFFSGDKITFQPFADRTCGGAAIGSGTIFKSPRIRIAGAEPTYEGTFSFNVEGGSTLEDCTAKTINFTVQLADLNALDGLPATTGAADTVYVTMPGVLDFVPGSFLCTTVPVGNCPVFISSTIQPDGRNLLKFKLPASMSIPNGGVVAINFSFDAVPEANIHAR
jgi:hypothetical protein